MFEYAVEQTQKEVFLQHSIVESNYFDAESSGLLQGNHPRFPEDAVSLVGLDAMISEFCGGIGEYSPQDVEEVFDLIASFGSGTGYILREEYDAFLLAMTNTKSEHLSLKSKELAAALDRVLAKTNQTKPMNRSHKTHGRRSIQDSGDLLKTMIAENGDFIQDWSIFYCGGSDAIKKSLEDISQMYGLSFAVEKFDW